MNSEDIFDRISQLEKEVGILIESFMRMQNIVIDLQQKLINFRLQSNPVDDVHWDNVHDDKSKDRIIKFCPFCSNTGIISDIFLDPSIPKTPENKICVCRTGAIDHAKKNI